jgi:UDP-N-acetylmuramate--alanine ligase
MKKGIKKIYFIGIGGTAISGLAVLASEQGYQVHGSDVDEVFVTTKVLKQKKISFHKGFAASHLNWNPDLVVIGASWGKDNVEVAEVLKRKIPTRTHSEFMQDLSEGKKLIAICGTHGKTTTTSLAAFLMREADLDPSFLIGAGASPELGTNAHEGTSEYFVVEADEYKKSRTQNIPKFMDLEPEYVLLTSLELDHTDFFKSLSDMKKYFREFLKKKSIKKVFVNCDDPNTKDVIQGLGKKVVKIGMKPNADYRIDGVQELEVNTKFTLHRGQRVNDFSTKLPGIFSVKNISLVLALLDEIKLPLAKVEAPLAQFKGAVRRFDISKKGKLTVVDDYAHHPTACLLTLNAVRKRFPHKNIICVFQPHQVTRTKYFKDEFAKAFTACDEVIFADIFASARETAKGYTSEDLAQLTLKYQEKVSAGGSLEKIAKELSRRKLGERDLLVTMGAGDVYKLVDLIH